MELHIFTNSTKSSPSTWCIEKTYASFVKTFGEHPVTVWCDPNPNINKSDKYIKNLKSLFKDVRVTESLSDGYIKAVKSSDCEYMFMLEHDWVFVQPLDSIKEITKMMDKHGITHLRFNKRRNEVTRADKELTEGEKFCWTPFVSNNPHIIHRDRWLKEAFPYVKIARGSGGLEHMLGDKGVRSAIYGPLFFERKICHLDGRKNVTPQKTR